MVKVNLGYQDLGEAQIYRFASETRDGLFHYVLRHLDNDVAPNNRLTCTCEGFQFTKNCKHIRSVTS